MPDLPSLIRDEAHHVMGFFYSPKEPYDPSAVVGLILATAAIAIIVMAIIHHA